MFLVKTLPLIETFKIFNKEKQKEYLKLWDKQKEILFLMHNVRNIILLKPRQFGISILTGGDSLLQCAIQKGFVFLCISINGPDAEEYLDKAYKMWLTLPEWFRASHPIVSKTDNEIEFEFESRFVALPANRGSGFTADRVMIDEFFKINRTRSKITIEEVLSNVDSTLDKMEGQLFLCGTADGFNTQRDMYLESKKANSEREAIFISCWDDPNLTPEIREQKAKKLKKKVNQEYPRTDREAFLSSGSPRFNLDTIVNFYEQRTIECKVKGNINNEHRIEINEDGFISFYFKKKVRGQYLISADVAEGLEKGDYSCAKVFDLEDWNQCAEWHGHIEHAEFGTEVYKMATHWNNAIVAIEANNHGHTSIERLKTTHKYPVSLIHQSKISKEKAVHWGSALYAFGWIIKIFITTAFQLFIVGAYHSITSILLRTPFDVLTYEIASDQGHYVDEFTVLREMAINLGRTMMAILIILISFYFAIQWVFILAAMATVVLNLLEQRNVKFNVD